MNFSDTSTAIDIKQSKSVGYTLSWSNINVYGEKTEKLRLNFTKSHKPSQLNEDDDSSEKTLCSSNNNFKGVLRCFKKSQSMTQILSNVNGIVYPGESLAIMGSSGSGKSTLLNALNNRLSNKFIMSGNVQINGQKFYSNELSNRIGYIFQDDIFIGTLTVKEHLTFLAMMKMSKSITNEDKMKRVDEVLREFNLLKCKDTLIGYVDSQKGISGGEKRRLAFASEILTHPDILFCDEPTSGLDSHMALIIVNTIKKLAMNGMTIVCVIHQPSSQIYEKFDKVCFLAEGKVAYFGKREEACNFFSSIGYNCPLQYNPADYFIEILASSNSETNIQTICNNFQQSENYAKLIDENQRYQDITVNTNRNFFNSYYSTSFLIQFLWLLWRQFRSSLRDSMTTRIQFIQSVGIGLFLGFTYFQIENDQSSVQDKNGLIFMVLMQAVIAYIFAVANHFHSQWFIINREVKNGTYSVIIYFLAKILSELPLNVISSTLMVTLVYWLSNLHPDIWVFLKIAALLVLTANTSVAYGTFLAVSCPDLDTSIGLIAPTVVPLLIFSGFLINNDNIPVYFIWIKYISWIYYSNESIMIMLWSSIDTLSCPALNNNTTIIAPCLNNGNDVLKQFAIEKDNLNRNIGILASQVFIWFSLAAVILYLKTRK